MTDSRHNHAHCKCSETVLWWGNLREASPRLRTATGFRCQGHGAGPSPAIPLISRLASLPGASELRDCEILERVAVGFAGPYPQRVIDRRHKNLAVADLAGARARGNDVNRLVGKVRGDGDFDS